MAAMEEGAAMVVVAAMGVEEVEGVTVEGRRPEQERNWTVHRRTAEERKRREGQRCWRRAAECFSLLEGSEYGAETSCGA